jgi:hypothetical protein
MTARALTFALLALALVAAGCGGDDEGKPIPAATATQLDAQLDGVQARLDNGTAGACKDILEGPRGPNLEQVNQIIESLPDDVDSDVRSALQDSFDNLWDRVQDKCDELAQKQEQQPTETQTTPTETETQTETTPTETTPTETTPTETTPPQDEQLPGGEGNGNGGGNGNGNGNGNGGGTGVGGGISPDGANLGGGE